jgi:predicted nucleic acid-binding protein
VIAVDTNIISYLYTVNVYAARAKSLLDQDADWVSPILWRSELRNALAGAMRHSQLQIEDAWAIQAEAEEMMADGEFQPDSTFVLDLVNRSDCSAYDCEYVALAKQLGVKLVTMDKKVLSAFPETAMPLPELG